jgi:serine/threonine-protein kinase HipA
MSELLTFLGDNLIGTLRRDANGRLSFVYDDAWSAMPDAYPLSLSLPIAAREHGHAAIETYLWGLLPDNEVILDRWAKRFQVSARNVFKLLEHVGEDCAGAVWFCTRERASVVRRAGRIEWLDEDEIAHRLRALRGDASAWRAVDDQGQFSLGGAQAKTALAHDGKRWGIPTGRRPTTHILKPGIADLAGHAENEHFCLRLAQELGLPAATSRIVRFRDEVAIAVERFDRVRDGELVLRVHQEDLCQSLGLPPSRKYESDRGPGPRAVVALLREHSSAFAEDVATFVDALAFSWLIGGTDAHAKNYSLLIGASGKARLAPLYDLASALPYHPLRTRKLKLAMKIGGKYRLHEISGYHFRKLAAELKVDGDEVRDRLRAMASQLADAAATVAREMRREKHWHGVIDDLVKALTTRTVECRTTLR